MLDHMVSGLEAIKSKVMHRTQHPENACATSHITVRIQQVGKDQKGISKGLLARFAPSQHSPTAVKERAQLDGRVDRADLFIVFET